MVAFYQFLEARLHLLRGGADLQSQRIESLALRVADRSSFRACFLLGPDTFAKQAEWIGVSAESTHVRPHRAFAGSHLPGGTVAGQRVLLVGHHRRIAHPGEEIVGLIVFAHMVQAETPVLLFAAPAFWRAVRRFFLAAMPFAARATGFWTAILLRLDADAIKKRRVEFHDRPLCAFAGDAFKA